MLSTAKVFYLQWHITERCNLHCAHCYQQERRPELGYEQQIELFERFARLPVKLGRSLDVALTGGEPFLSPSFYDLLAYLCRQDDLVRYIDVLTNGTLIDLPCAQRLAELGVHRVSVSIDGGTAEIHDAIRGPGNFKRALVGVEALLAAGVKVAVQTVVHRLNYRSVPALVELLAGYNARVSFAATRLVPEGRGETLQDAVLTASEIQALFTSLNDMATTYRERLEILRGRDLWRLIDPEVGGSCSIGTSGLCLMPDGVVLPCRRLPIEIGDLTKQGVFEIWYGSSLLWELRDRDKLQGKCGTCPYREVCGGCRAVAYGVTGNYLAEDPQCWRPAS